MADLDFPVQDQGNRRIRTVADVEAFWHDLNSQTNKVFRRAEKAFSQPWEEGMGGQTVIKGAPFNCRR